MQLCYVTTFMESEAARDKWHELRNDWLVRHGYAPRGPDDWDPMKAPVEAPKRQGGSDIALTLTA